MLGADWINMIVIKVFGLPALSEEKLQSLFCELGNAVEGQTSLGLQARDDIGIHFPLDAMSFRRGSIVNIEVMGLTDRTHAIIHELFSSLEAVVRGYVTPPTMIKSIIVDSSLGESLPPHAGEHRPRNS